MGILGRMSSLDMTVQVILLRESYSTKTARTEWPGLGWSILVAVFLMKSKMESRGRGKITFITSNFSMGDCNVSLEVHVERGSKRAKFTLEKYFLAWWNSVMVCYMIVE